MLARQVSRRPSLTLPKASSYAHRTSPPGFPPCIPNSSAATTSQPMPWWQAKGPRTAQTVFHDSRDEPCNTHRERHAALHLPAPCQTNGWALTEPGARSTCPDRSSARPERNTPHQSDRNGTVASGGTRSALVISCLSRSRRARKTLGPDILNSLRRSCSRPISTSTV